MKLINKTYLKSQLETGKFVFYICDTITIKSHEGCISSTLDIEYRTRTKDVERLSLKNDIKTWTFLKNINKQTYVNVLMESSYWNGDVKTIPYKDSLPYQHRFGK